MRRVLAGIVIGVIATITTQRVVRFVNSNRDADTNEIFRWSHQHVPAVLEPFRGAGHTLDVWSQNEAVTPSERSRGETRHRVRIVYEIDGKIRAITLLYRMANGKFVGPSDDELRLLNAAAATLDAPSLSAHPAER